MGCYKFGPFLLNPELRALLRHGEAVDVTGKTLETLIVLVQNRGKVMDKDELMAALWPDTVVEEANLTQNVSTLRKILGDNPKDHRYIVTIPGRGYQFVAAITETTALGVVPEKQPGHSRALRHNVVRWGLTTLVTIVVLVLAYAYLRRAPEETRVFKLSVLPPEKASLPPGPVLAVSPDGRRLAFVATADGKNLVWIRDLNTTVVRPLLGAEGMGDPFWSPDGRFIAFFGEGGKLKKIDTTGGPAVSLCDGTGGVGGTWSKNDVILFAPNASSVLFRIPASGGNATAVTALDPALSEHSHRWPWFLPDGHHFLYTAYTLDQKKTTVYIGDLDSQDHLKTRRRVLSANSNVVYAPPGFLLFVREGVLIAQPFDVSKAKITGDPAPIAEQVDYIGDWSQGQFSSSQNGVLAYRNSGSASVQLTWFDRQGKTLGTVGEPGLMVGPAISPDGRTVAVDRFDIQKGVLDVWLYDLTRSTASRFTFSSKRQGDADPQGSFLPAWSPDGGHIAFASTRDGGVLNLYEKAMNSSAQDGVLDHTARSKAPSDWSRDGRNIIEYVWDPKGKTAVWVLPLFGDRKPFPYLQTEFEEHSARLSPDGQLLAYTSDETKRHEIYVQTFPDHGGKWMVSNNGGSLPVWSRDGKELFYIGADQRMMAVEVKTAVGNHSRFEASVPKPLFATHLDVSFPYYRFDVSPDGRFLLPALVSSAPITVEVNWTAGLKK